MYLITSEKQTGHFIAISLSYGRQIIFIGNNNSSKIHKHHNSVSFIPIWQLKLHGGEKKKNH